MGLSVVPDLLYAPLWVLYESKSPSYARVIPAYAPKTNPMRETTTLMRHRHKITETRQSAAPNFLFMKDNPPTSPFVQHSQPKKSRKPQLGFRLIEQLLQSSSLISMSSGIGSFKYSIICFLYFSICSRWLLN